MNIQSALSILLGMSMFSACIKTKTPEVYDNYISLKPKEHFEVISFQISRIWNEIESVSFHVKHGQDTIVFSASYTDGIFVMPNSVVEISSANRNLIKESTRAIWISQDAEYVEIENPDNIQMKFHFYDNALERDTYGAKEVYLNINESTVCYLDVPNPNERNEMQQSHEKMMEFVNNLMKELIDKDEFTEGVQPFFTSGYVSLH